MALARFGGLGSQILFFNEQEEVRNHPSLRPGHEIRVVVTLCERCLLVINKPLYMLSCCTLIFYTHSYFHGQSYYYSDLADI